LYDFGAAKECSRWEFSSSGENFTHIPGESIDAMLQQFIVIVNNMRANVVALPYDDHDRAIKLLHSRDRTMWSEKVKTLTVDELFSKVKLSEVDRGVRARIENRTNPHSLALVSGSRTNANPSSRMYSLSSLVSFPDDGFDMLGEDDLALLLRRFERMYENQMSSRRNSRTCFMCAKTGHFFAEYAKLNDDTKHKSKKKDHGHGRKIWSREKMKKLSDVESDCKDTSSSSSDEEEEGDKKKKNNLNKYLNGLCVMVLISKDDFCGMARSSSSNRSQKDASDSD
jgi:hypothetical protein